jgi:hypothetical protein
MKQLHNSMIRFKLKQIALMRAQAKKSRAAAMQREQEQEQRESSAS